MLGLWSVLTHGNISSASWIVFWHVSVVSQLVQQKDHVNPKVCYIVNKDTRHCLSSLVFHVFSSSFQNISMFTCTMWIPIKDTEGQIHCILEAFTAVFSNAKKESLTFKSFWTRTSHLPTICRGTEKESSGCHVCTQGFLGLLVLTIELPPVVQPEYLYKSESPEHRFRHCNVVEITKLHNQSAESHIL